MGVTNFHHKTPPRQMAAAIMAQKTKKARASMLMQCPGEWQALIKKHVENGWRRR